MNTNQTKNWTRALPFISCLLIIIICFIDKNFVAALSWVVTFVYLLLYSTLEHQYEILKDIKIVAALEEYNNMIKNDTPKNHAENP
jgi:hypothetical protein